MNKILNCNVIEGLKQLPDKSVDCVITSPPYWGLRDYGSKTETIWDAVEDCEHEWGNTIKYAKEDNKTPEQKNAQGATVGNSINSENFAKRNSGCFCVKCSAWRGQLGLEPDFNLYIKHLIQIFNEVKRVLKKSGTCWVNLGDTYYGGGNNRGNNSPISEKQSTNRGATGQVQMKWGRELHSKCLCQIPSRFAIAMTDAGWILRNEIIWYKRNCMPSSVKDRFTVDFEKVYFFVKNKKYWFEQQFEPHWSKPKNKIVGAKNSPVQQSQGDPGGEHAYGANGRNMRCVWDITTQPYKDAHFATFPEALVKPMIKAGSPKEGIVLDIFAGSGTTLKVARDLYRQYIGIEINPKYCKLINKRLTNRNMNTLKEWSK